MNLFVLIFPFRTDIQESFLVCEREKKQILLMRWNAYFI